MAGVPGDTENFNGIVVRTAPEATTKGNCYLIGASYGIAMESVGNGLPCRFFVGGSGRAVRANKATGGGSAIADGGAVRYLVGSDNVTGAGATAPIGVAIGAAGDSATEVLVVMSVFTPAAT